MAIFADLHPFIAMSALTAAVALLFHAFKYNLGVVIPYVLLASPASIIQQSIYLEAMYTEQELLDFGIDVDTFPEQAWIAITVVFALYAMAATLMKGVFDAS